MSLHIFMFVFNIFQSAQHLKCRRGLGYKIVQASCILAYTAKLSMLNMTGRIIGMMSKREWNKIRKLKWLIRKISHSRAWSVQNISTNFDSQLPSSSGYVSSAGCSFYGSKLGWKRRDHPAEIVRNATMTEMDDAHKKPLKIYFDVSLFVVDLIYSNGHSFKQWRHIVVTTVSPLIQYTFVHVHFTFSICPFIKKCFFNLIHPLFVVVVVFFCCVCRNRRRVLRSQCVLTQRVSTCAGSIKIMNWTHWTLRPFVTCVLGHMRKSHG